MPFKMFGLHRTGSNLMVALLTKNFDVHFIEAGAEWKHGPVLDPDRLWNGVPVRFILTVRNPYAWALSCYRYFRWANIDKTRAPQFIRDPSVSFDEFLLSPSYDFASPIHRWNELNRSWLDRLPPDRTSIVRQEDQVVDQVKVLETVESKLELTRKTPDISTLEERITVNVSAVGPYNRDPDLDREYMLEYTPSLLSRVNELIDPLLMQRFKYAWEYWALAEREIGGTRIVVRPCTSDAGDAREIAADPYRFANIVKTGDEIRTVVDVGAHIGATVLLARRLWPKCHVSAYEPCPENNRVLRINARKAGQVTTLQCALTEEESGSAAFPNASPTRNGWYATGTRSTGCGFDQVPAVTLANAFDRLGSIDLLKIGCPASAIPILRHAVATGAVQRINWICAGLPSGQRAQEVTQLLFRTHAAQVNDASTRPYLQARRLT